MAGAQDAEARGLHDAGEDLLGRGAVGGAIAAGDLAIDHGGPQRLFERVGFRKTMLEMTCELDDALDSKKEPVSPSRT